MNKESRDDRGSEIQTGKRAGIYFLRMRMIILSLKSDAFHIPSEIFYGILISKAV